MLPNCYTSPQYPSKAELWKTLTQKEGAELLGISRGTVMRWVLEGRLEAYRVSDRPKYPHLFTREDCLATLQNVLVEPVRLNVETNEKNMSFS